MSKGRSLPVILSKAALQDLDEIATWNEDTYGIKHAKRYLQFLGESLEDLGETHSRGKRIDGRPECLYVQIRRRSSGYGHLAVYKVEDGVVKVLRIFHSAQNWRSQIAEGS